MPGLGGMCRGRAKIRLRFDRELEAPTVGMHPPSGRKISHLFGFRPYFQQITWSYIFYPTIRFTRSNFLWKGPFRRICRLCEHSPPHQGMQRCRIQSNLGIKIPRQTERCLCCLGVGGSAPSSRYFNFDPNK